MEIQLNSDSLSHLLSYVGKSITKTTVPILECFLFNFDGSTLKVTASNLENSVTGEMPAMGEAGDVAVPAKIFLDALKQLRGTNLIISVDSNMTMTVKHAHGSITIPCQKASAYPHQFDNIATASQFEMDVDALYDGIAKTIDATANDELRPIMNGVYMCSGVFVGTDAHKLVKYTTEDVNGNSTPIVIPKASANILRNILKKASGRVSIRVDANRAVFSINGYEVSSVLVEGHFPNFDMVIPAKNPYVAKIDKQKLMDAIKRVSVCANPSTSLIKLAFTYNALEVSAEDFDFARSAKETLPVEYSDAPMEIGFKADFLQSILNTIESDDVILELADCTRACVFKQTNKDNLIALLMPMMLN